MNRTDLVKKVAETLDSPVQAETVVEVMVKAITESLAAGERVHITGLGSFVAEQVPSRMVRNPATGKKVRAKKTAKVTFSLGEHLKEVLAGRKKMAGVKVDAAVLTMPPKKRARSRAQS